MVLIPIPDEVWKIVKLSWIPFGVYDEKELIKVVVDDLLFMSDSIIDDAEEHPENYGEQEMLMFRQEKLKQKLSFRTLGDVSRDHEYALIYFR